MANSQLDTHVDDFDIVQRGFSHRLARHFGVSSSTASRRMWKVLLLLLVTWLPLAILSLWAGHAFGNRVAVPFFHDPEVHARLLFSLPLLEIGEVVVALGLRVQARHLLERGIVSERDRAGFEEAQRNVIALRESTLAEIVILIVAYALSLTFRFAMGISDSTSSWERVNRAMTPAGYWHALVGLPLLYFFILRWLFVILVWARFLYLVSRLHLELTPTHPDHTGGLGFLGWGLASFATVVMATSAVVSAGFAAEILQHGESLNSLKYHVVIYVAVVMLILHAPLLSFSGQLTRCRFTGLLEFGALVWRHDRAFDEKWLTGATHASQESILGISDVQSMADMAACYDHINEMWLIPFDVKAFAVLVLAALIPMAPLLATAIPLQEIFVKLGEMLI